MASRHNITKQVRAVIIFIFHFRTSFSNISSKTGNRTYIGVGLSSQFKVVLPIVGTTEPETMPFSKIKSRLESTWPASVFIYLFQTYPSFEWLNTNCCYRYSLDTTGFHLFEVPFEYLLLR